MGGAMSSITLNGDISGSAIIQAPSVAGTPTLTLPTTSGTFLTSANTFANSGGPAFSAYNTGAGATLSTGGTKVTFDTEEFDTNNNFASSRFTPTVAGYYQINAQIQPNNTYTGGWIGIHKNGSTYKYGTYVNTGVSFGGFTVSSIVYCNGSTDYIEIYGAFTSSQPTGSSIYFTYFNGAMIRGA